MLAACSSGDAGPSPAFPKTFLWGAAIAGFQVDMGCPTIPAAQCDDPASDWYQWVTDQRILEKREQLHFVGGPPSTGPGFYELFPEDLGRAKNELGLGSVRLSIEWSRIFPTSTEGIEGYEALKAVASVDGVAFYRRIFAKMKELGLVPLVTINHYTLPQWLHDGAECHLSLSTCTKRGWLDTRTVTEARKYGLFVGREFGAEVDLWATLNEPLANTLAGYLSPGKDRVHPPGLSFQAKPAKTVTMNMIRGHAAMYDGLKEGDTTDIDGDGKASQVGLVFNMAPIIPADPDDGDDVQAAKNLFYLYDELFLTATIDGKLDVEAAGPEAAVVDPSLVGRMDYLGINYYTRITADGTVGSVLPEFSPLLTLNVVSPETKLYEDYPRGLYEMAMYVKNRWNLPIYITENGYSKPDDAAGLEAAMVETIGWMKKAVDEGADVRGYYWWSLMDNYEWNHGMEDYRFGLYAVDDEDPRKPRTRRPAVDVYARIVRANQVPDDLAAKYPTR